MPEEQVPNISDVDLELVDDDDTPESSPDGDQTVVPPLPTDPGWTEYVLKQLTEDEMYDGWPKCDGLRRVTAQLLGPIISSKPTFINAPTADNGYHATVGWEAVIQFADGNRTFGDVADVGMLNTEEPYCLHSSASAATKAEGRCYKKALLLRNVYSAEEMMDTPEDTGRGGRVMNKQQQNFLDMFCHDLNINAKALLEATAKKSGVKDVRAIQYTTAVKLMSSLNQVQLGTKPVPAEYVGYDPKWKALCGLEGEN